MPAAVANMPEIHCLASKALPKKKVSPSLKPMLDRMPSEIAVIVSVACNLPNSYKRKLDNVMASTSVRPEIKATTYNPLLPAISDNQAAQNSTTP